MTFFPEMVAIIAHSRNSPAQHLLSSSGMSTASSVALPCYFRRPPTRASAPAVSHRYHVHPPGTRAISKEPEPYIIREIREILAMRRRKVQWWEMAMRIEKLSRWVLPEHKLVGSLSTSNWFPASGSGSLRIPIGRRGEVSELSFGRGQDSIR